jgi:hypothetical protein
MDCKSGGIGLEMRRYATAEAIKIGQENNNLVSAGIRVAPSVASGVEKDRHQPITVRSASFRVFRFKYECALKFGETLKFVTR